MDNSENRNSFGHSLSSPGAPSEMERPKTSQNFLDSVGSAFITFFGFVVNLGERGKRCFIPGIDPMLSLLAEAESSTDVSSLLRCSGTFVCTPGPDALKNTAPSAYVDFRIISAAL